MIINKESLKIDGLTILIGDLIGCNIFKNKNKIYLKIYYFIKKLNKNNNISRKIKKYKYYDEYETLIKFKNEIRNIINSKFKILFIINPFSGQKNGSRIFENYKYLFISRGIEISYFVTEYQNDALNFIRDIDKSDLLIYDTICGLGGDGIIHEIINGFGLREDFDKEEFLNFVKIGTIPTGSGNALVENILKNSNLEYSIENSIYLLLKNKVLTHSIQSYTILNKKKNFKININNKDKKKQYKILNIFRPVTIIQTKTTIDNELDSNESLKYSGKDSENEEDENRKISKKIRLSQIESNNYIEENNYSTEKIYGFLSYNYGYFSEVDLNSEVLRFLGKLRFEVYGFFKLIKTTVCIPSIILYNDDQNIPNLYDFYSDNFDKKLVNCYKGNAYSSLFTSLPYLMRGYKCSPSLTFNTE